MRATTTRCICRRGTISEAPEGTLQNRGCWPRGRHPFLRELTRPGGLSSACGAGADEAEGDDGGDGDEDAHDDEEDDAVALGFEAWLAGRLGAAIALSVAWLGHEFVGDTLAVLQAFPLVEFVRHGWGGEQRGGNHSWKSVRRQGETGKE